MRRRVAKKKVDSNSKLLARRFQNLNLRARERVRLRVWWWSGEIPAACRFCAECLCVVFLPGFTVSLRDTHTHVVGRIRRRFSSHPE